MANPASIIQRGTSLPTDNNPNTAGRLFFMESGGSITGLYRDNGSSWELANLSGSSISNGYYYVDSATYSGNIQAAIDDAYAAGGGTVFLGKQQYTTTGIVLKDKVTLLGSHWRKTILYSSTNAPIIQVSTTAFEAGIINLTVKGSIAAGSSQIGIAAHGSSDYWGLVIKDVWIQDTGGIGFSVNQRPFSVVFDNIHVDNCAGYPFQFDCPYAPAIALTNSYAHALRATGLTAFRIKSGRIYFENVNGIDNNPALANSNWAVLGKKNGVDGDATDSGATAIFNNCNFEQFYSYGILAYSYSTVSVLGKSGFAGGNSGSHIGIKFDLAGDGSSYYAQYLTRGYIEDTVDFADGASAYANSQPIHANGYAPIQIIGQGPLQGGSPNPKLNSYYSTVTLSTMLLSRADGNVTTDVVTADKSYTQPGVRYIELNHNTPITVTLPWPGWYARAQEIIYIKDRSSAGATTNNVTLSANGGGTVNGSSFTINKTGQSILLIPDGSGDYRIVASYIDFSLISEAGGGVGINGFLQADDIYVRSFSNVASGAPSFNRRRHRGTSSALLAIQSGDTIGYDSWQGQYDTVDGHRNTTAYITVSATENFDATHGGTKITLTAAQNGSTNGLSRGFTLNPTDSSLEPISTGSLSLGSSTVKWASAYINNLLITTFAYINNLVALSQSGSVLEVGLGYTSNGVKIYGGGSNEIRIDGNGNVRLGATGGMSTSATDGFPYIRSGAGAPTGTPTALTGMVPLYYDTSNNKLYVYNGAWKQVTLT